MKDVVGRHHEHAGFKLGFKRQWHVNGHLVTVEVGVECRADERVKLNSLAFDKHRLEGLNAETMERRRAVQHHRMLADNLVEDIPHFWLFLFNQLLGLLDGGRQTLGVETRIDERLEEFERHLLRQAALMQLEFWTHDDNGATRVIDALAKQVLAETALLALEHIGERLQWTLIRACDDATTTTIVEQRVDRLLQHALLVTDNDIRRTKFDEALQSIVAVDDAAIEIVQIGGRETATIQRNERTKIWWDNRYNRQDHPFWLIARHHERFDDLQTLGELLRLQFRG